MFKENNSNFSILHFLLGLFVFLPHPSYADCSKPDAPKGGLTYFAAPDMTYRYCDGENWIDLKRQHSTDETARVDVVLPSYSNIAVPEPAKRESPAKLNAPAKEPNGGTR